MAINWIKDQQAGIQVVKKFVGERMRGCNQQDSSEFESSETSQFKTKQRVEAG